MTWQVLITVFTLGGIGAMVRGGIILILASSSHFFPLAILIVNMLAAFLGGFILSLNLPADLLAALSIGLVGGIGTLSSIPSNIMDLVFDRGFRRLAIYLAITIFGGVLVAQAGISTGNFITQAMRPQTGLSTEMLLNSLSQQESHIEQLREKSLENIDPEILKKIQEQQNQHVLEPLNDDESIEPTKDVEAPISDNLKPKEPNLNTGNEHHQDTVKEQSNTGIPNTNVPDNVTSDDVIPVDAEPNNQEPGA